MILAAGATSFRALPSEGKVSAAGSARPALAVERSSRITVQPSGQLPELKLREASDLPEYETQSLASALPTAVMASDIDGDGRSDLVTAYRAGGGGEIRVRSGASDGELALPRLYSLGSSVPKAIATGEFTGDFRNDLVIARGDSISVMAGTAEGEFIQGPSLHLGGEIVRLATSDFNRDGLVDIVALNVQENKLIGVIGNADLRSATPFEIAFDELVATEV